MEMAFQTKPKFIMNFGNFLIVQTLVSFGKISETGVLRQTKIFKQSNGFCSFA